MLMNATITNLTRPECEPYLLVALPAFDQKDSLHSVELNLTERTRYNQSMIVQIRNPQTNETFRYVFTDNETALNAQAVLREYGVPAFIDLYADRALLAQHLKLQKET